MTALDTERAARAQGPNVLLEVRDLSVVATSDGRDRTLVKDVNLTLHRGEALAVVGESGSGKSITAKAMLRLLPQNVMSHGSVMFDGVDISSLGDKQLRALRGSGFSLLMQDPFSMLNPLQPVGLTIAESLQPARSARSAGAEVERRLSEVGLKPDVADKYPFQLSGGMRQRVAIAASLAADPRLLIADEPTTALDATTQGEVLELLARLRAARHMALVLITHDLKVAFQVCDRSLVLYAGDVVEDAGVEQLRDGPLHPYTAGLLRSELSVERYVEHLTSIAGSVPQASTIMHQCGFADRCEWAINECRAEKPPLRLLGDDRATACIRSEELASRLEPVVELDVPAVHVHQKSERESILQVKDLHKVFHTNSMFGRSQSTTALDHVSFTIARGESVGLVGESGSGKTTIARSILGLVTVDSGSILLDGHDVSDYRRMSRQHLRAARRSVQAVFQDPYGSLNPARSVGDALKEAVQTRNDVAKDALQVEVEAALDLVGLPAHYASRRPATLSGGERQRVSIARAVAARPQLLICDEPVAALDVSVQAQILDLLRGVREKLGISMLFITHDLSVVRQMAERAVVLYHGQVVEHGPIEAVLGSPRCDYTKTLLAAARMGDVTPDSATLSPN